MTISTSQVEERLSKLIDPVVGTDYVSARMLKGIETDDKGGVVVHIELGYPARRDGSRRCEAEHHCA